MRRRSEVARKAWMVLLGRCVGSGSGRASAEATPRKLISWRPARSARSRCAQNSRPPVRVDEVNMPDMLPGRPQRVGDVISSIFMWKRSASRTTLPVDSDRSSLIPTRACSRGSSRIG